MRGSRPLANFLPGSRRPAVSQVHAPFEDEAQLLSQMRVHGELRSGSDADKAGVRARAGRAGLKGH